LPDGGSSSHDQQGKGQMKIILMLIVGLMLAGCGSMENHVHNRDAVDAICACP
jgi:hypothetical protein